MLLVWMLNMFDQSAASAVVYCCSLYMNEYKADLFQFSFSWPQFFKRFHAAYVDAVSNPFHVPGKKITSKTFAERVSTIVKSFGLSSTGWMPHEETERMVISYQVDRFLFCPHFASSKNWCWIISYIFYGKKHQLEVVLHVPKLERKMSIPVIVISLSFFWRISMIIYHMCS